MRAGVGVALEAALGGLERGLLQGLLGGPAGPDRGRVGAQGEGGEVADQQAHPGAVDGGVGEHQGDVPHQAVGHDQAGPDRPLGAAVESTARQVQVQRCSGGGEAGPVGAGGEVVDQGGQGARRVDGLAQSGAVRLGKQPGVQGVVQVQQVPEGGQDQRERQAGVERGGGADVVAGAVGGGQAVDDVPDGSLAPGGGAVARAAVGEGYLQLSTRGHRGGSPMRWCGCGVLVRMGAVGAVPESLRYGREIAPDGGQFR